MGDRGNIVIRSQTDGDIWLYTHWGGSTLREDLRDALIAGRSRWDDPSYLARIVFCGMLQGDMAGTTGFGISTRKLDNENEILVVDTDAQEVQTYPKDYSAGEAEPVSRAAFGDYVASRGVEVVAP